MKDFFDIWLMSQHFEFDGQVLAMAITRTFANRQTKIPPEPIALTPFIADDPSKQTQWRAFTRKNRLENAPKDLREVIAVIATFLGPVAMALAKGEPFEGTWHPGGNWSGY